LETRLLDCAYQFGRLDPWVGNDLGLPRLEIDLSFFDAGNAGQRMFDLGRARRTSHPFDAQQAVQVAGES